MDETYIKDLWDWTVSKDPAFTDRYTFESWKEKLGNNEQYQQDFHAWLSSKDATFSKRRPIDEWTQLVKKKDSFEVTSEGQPLVSEQAIGTSDVSGATDIDNIKDIEQQQLTDYSQTEQALADGTELSKFQQAAPLSAPEESELYKNVDAKAKSDAAELKAIEDEKLYKIKRQEFNDTYKKPEQKSFGDYKRDLAKELNFNHKGATKDEVDRFERDSELFYKQDKRRYENKAEFNRDVAFFTENPGI